MEILCRIDPAETKPVVFITDTIHDGKIQAWRGEGNPEYVPLDYYHMTAPLSAADERILLTRFKEQTGKQDQVVKLRQRLPRTHKALPNVLATDASTAPVSATVGTVATTHAQPVQSTPEPVKRGRKPVVSQLSVAQATPADVMAAITSLGKEFSNVSQQFNSKLEELAKLLAPKV